MLPLPKDLVAEAVRSGKLTILQARTLLGIWSRYEMDGFLKACGVFLNLTGRRSKGHRCGSYPVAMTVVVASSTDMERPCQSACGSVRFSREKRSIGGG